MSVQFGLPCAAMSLLAGLATGCGGKARGESSAAEAPMSDAGAAPVSNTGTVTDASVNAGSSTQGGFIQVVQIKSGDIYSAVFGAQFHSRPETAPTGLQDCTSTTSGACTVQECSRNFIDAGVHSPQIYALAGKVTVTSASGSSVAMAPKPDGSGNYTNGAWQGEFYAGGSVTFSAAGDSNGVPAFSGIQLATPTSLATTPALSKTTPMVLPRTTDFVLRWTPTTGAGNVKIELDSFDDQTNVIIRCATAASGGAVTVPKDLLAKLKDSRVTNPNAIRVVASNATVVNVGNFTIDLSADTDELYGSFLTE